MEAKIDLVGVSRSAEAPSDALVAQPAPGEPIAQSNSAIDAEPLPKAKEAVVDTVLAVFGLPGTHPSLPTPATTPHRAADTLANDRDLLLIQSLLLSHNDSGETDQDAGPAPKEESGGAGDEPQPAASVDVFFGGLG